MKRPYMTPPSRRLLSTAAPLLVLAATGAHAQSTSWRMSPVTSYQARVETYAPVWNKEHAVWVSGVPGNLTFEQQYAATLDSVTTSSVEGALMYLQRDCIDVGATPWTSPKSSRCQRKNNVKVITFLEVQIANPNAALAEYQSDRFTYPEFCPFVEMKDGACIYTNDTVSPVVTINQPAECKQYNGIDGQPKIGPCVGAEAFPTDNVAPYFDTVWFSYPNSCVMNRWADGKTPACRTQYPGGLCPFGTVPDGVTCQFSYKILGYINIDDLVGITAMDARGVVNGSALVDDDAAAEASLLNGRNVLANPGLDSLSGSKGKGKEEGAEASGSLTGSGSKALSITLGDDDDDDGGDSAPANTTFGTWKCRRPGACYKSFWEFCEANNTEFHSTDKDRTLGLSAVTSIEFWGYPSDHRVNKNRTAFMIHMYNKQVKERNKVSVEKMTLLPTVADLDEITKKNPPCYQNSLACYNAHYGCQRHSYAQVCSVCREMGVKCVTKKPSYEFPTLTKVPRSVPDSALRSKFVMTPNAKAANAAAGGGSTRPLGVLAAIIVAAAIAM